MNSNLFRGSLDTILLKMLSDRESMYGYELTKKIKEKTNGEVKIKEGSLYPALHRLEKKGFIRSKVRKVDGRMRKYYSLSDTGKTEVATQTEEMKSFIKNLNLILHPNIASS